MSDKASDGIHLTKEYYKTFMPTDLQWVVTKIDDDFNLYDLFHLIHHAQLLLPDIFITMGISEFFMFWNQIQLDRDPDDTDELKYLELRWCIYYDTREVKKTGKQTDQPNSNCSILGSDCNYWDNPKIGELSNLMDFHGVGPGCPCKGIDSHECGDDCPKETGYGVEFTTLNNLAHLPIRVSPKIEFYPPYVESDRDFHRTGFELTIEPTLWCLITSIFWELTFVGSTPNEISKETEKMTNRVKKIREHLEKEHKKNEES